MEAHFELLKSIHAIVKEDTGGPRICFAYIHSEGVKTWIADSHKGQALGLFSFIYLLISTAESNARARNVLSVVMP